MLGDGDKECDPSLTTGPQCWARTPELLLRTKARVSVVGKEPRTVGETERNGRLSPGREGNVSRKSRLLRFFLRRAGMGEGVKELMRKKGFSKNEDPVRKGHLFSR